MPDVVVQGSMPGAVAGSSVAPSITVTEHGQSITVGQDEQAVDAEQSSNSVAVLVQGAVSGMTQADADARYVLQSQINAPDGVAGLDADLFLTESQLPLPPIDLAVLVANKLT